ncbi:MAG: hypothetical protein M1836_001047 [Candelina mexicana]|nr:MAG: hypothetical protein M1836_001047 [Candelina mexicana]
MHGAGMTYPHMWQDRYSELCGNCFVKLVSIYLNGARALYADLITVLGKGVGPHQWDVSFKAFTPSLLRRFIVLDMLYSPTVLMIKLSILTLYLRAFQINVKLRYYIYSAMVFLVLFYSGTLIGYAVLSIPRPGQSELQSILSGHTAMDIPLGNTQGGVNVASDFYIFCLPIPAVWKLQLPLRKKLGVLATFATGLLACIASAFGLYYRVKLGRNSDVTWKLVYVLLWVVVELTVGIICSSVTSFPGFFRYHLPQVRASISLISSGLKYLHIPSSKSREPPSNNAKKLNTRDIKLTFGSRVDGKGLFINPDSDLNPAQDTDTDRQSHRNAHHEVIKGEQPGCLDDRNSSLVDPCSSSTQHNDFGQPVQAQHISGRPRRDVDQGGLQPPRWWERSIQPGTGYWDLVSLFRTRGTTQGSRHSKVHFESEDSRV